MTSFLVVLSVSVLLSGCKGCPEGERRIYWPGESEYSTIRDGFSLSESEAFHMVYEKYKDSPKRFVGTESVFITESEYFFSQDRKSGISLSGFYVNAFNGNVVFVASKTVLSKGDKCIPDESRKENRE